MFPNILLCSSRSDGRKKKSNRCSLESEDNSSFDTTPHGVNFVYPLPLERDPVLPSCKAGRFSLRSHRNGEFKPKKKGDMSGKVSSNFSDLIQRVAASCLLHPLAAGRQESGNAAGELYDYETDEYEEEEGEEVNDEEDGEAVGEKKFRAGDFKREVVAMERMVEMEMLMNQVFDSVAAMKRAYGSLQEAHCPWDPERLRVADVSVVGELRRLAVLRERFRRCVSIGSCFNGGARKKGGGGGGGGGMGLLREVVAPYEAAVEELKKEVKAKEVEVVNLQEKLRSATSNNGSGKKGRFSSQSKRKVNCSTYAAQVASSPAPELFEGTMSQVKTTSKSFTSLLLTHMRAAHWDITAAVRSIEAATAATDHVSTTTAIASTITAHHAKYALESYISRKIFQGFDHETFYMDGSLSSLLNPDQFRRDCFTQYRDMKAMDPVELLGILPTCHFGKFCSKKYLAIVHPKMEESLFGNLEQRQQVLDGSHPRSQFYGEFLVLAKAIWLLHLLAFSLDPPPGQFEASRGAEFHPQYMESVVRFSGGRIPAGQVVGFPVSPGFKLGSGSVIKASVYLVPRA